MKFWRWGLCRKFYNKDLFLRNVKEICYATTNESLKSIITGMNLSKEDEVLAIGGSGDQAFAILEFVKRVKVVDISSKQLAFINSRMAALKEMDVENFFEGDKKVFSGDFYPLFTQDVRNYFLSDNPDRLEKIRKKLPDFLIMDPEDIVKTAQKERDYSKIYLSNAISSGYYGKEGKMRENVTVSLSKISRNLPERGLIYVSQHNAFSDIARHEEEKFKNIPRTSDDLNETFFLPSELRLDRELSIKARKVRDFCGEFFWAPAVYVKNKSLCFIN